MSVEHKYLRGDFHFRTEANKVDDDWFEWKVELDEPKEVLRNIREVEYILHPTFPNRIRRATNPEHKFALEAEGWGDFDIVANIYFKSGEEKTVTVPLKLN